ncbi:MAG: type I methionyl aminopeptidase [Planctomycetota bacterium]
MIKIKTNEEVELIAKACRLTAQTFAYIEKFIKPGVSTKFLDMEAERFIVMSGGVPAFKGYKNYPATICASINDEVVHSIPSPDKVLKEGDNVSIDIGVCFNNFYGDMAKTYLVGNAKENNKMLVKVTEEALYYTISKIKAGEKLSSICKATEEYALKFGFNVIKGYVGHGIGHQLHEDPQVPNYWRGGGIGFNELILQPNMVIAIEPMLVEGTDQTITDADGWTVRTKDGKLAAHFEHTVLITETGYKILTQV